jgi:hypothetical protein
MRFENKPLLQDDPRFFQDITSTAVEVGLEFRNFTRRSKIKKARQPISRRASLHSKSPSRPRLLPQTSTALAGRVKNTASKSLFSASKLKTDN